MTINKKAEITLVLDLDEFVALREFIGRSNKGALLQQGIDECDIDTVFAMYTTMTNNQAKL